MNEIDFNMNFIVYVVYNGRGTWYVSDKDLWYLDYYKFMRLPYPKTGEKIDESRVDPKRQGLLYLDENNFSEFLERIESDKYSVEKLKNLFEINHMYDYFDYRPSLYIDVDKKIFYSFYSEPRSYEDYAPISWNSKYMDFYNLIPEKDIYWYEITPDEMYLYFKNTILKYGSCILAESDETIIQLILEDFIMDISHFLTNDTLVPILNAGMIDEDIYNKSLEMFFWGYNLFYKKNLLKINDIKTHTDWKELFRKADEIRDLLYW